MRIGFYQAARQVKPAFIAGEFSTHAIIAFFGGIRDPDNWQSTYFYDDQMISIPSYLLISIIRYWAVIHLPHEKAHSADGPCAFAVSFSLCSYSTVTLLARFLGLSTFRPFATLR